MHGVPLAEFALLGLLHFAKGMPSARRAGRRQRRWQRHATGVLPASRRLLVGLGGIGREVAGCWPRPASR